ncbi:hypothetical protein WJX75_001114 [Coccomyxa subellipsoidea]|uniref:Uncharacterized protein n=1 Tax=Coccomyxa subellipsoidea TaxID=248742 RepID=A0ABR2Z1N4_9CHLO
MNSQAPGSGNTASALLPFRGTATSTESRRREPAHREQDRPCLACLVLLPILLLGIACLSAAPLAGTRSGWGYFYQEGMDSVYLRDLTLTNWTHYIHIGYNEQTNAMRQYAWEQHWNIDGPVEPYGKLWDNFEFGDATQLVGGYTAGYLVVSCVTALAYFGLWLRCLVQMRRQDRGDLEGGTARAAVARGGPVDPAAGGTKGTAILIRPLGPWLWPVALLHTVLLAALVITFFLLMDATTAYQSLHAAPGQVCHVAPAWAWWCAMSAVFAWLTVAIVAAAEAIWQCRAQSSASNVLQSPLPLQTPQPPHPPSHRTIPKLSSY